MAVSRSRTLRASLPGTGTRMSGSGRLGSSQCCVMVSGHHRLGLLAQELGQIVQAAAGLAGAAGALPPSEGLYAGPRARRRACAPVDVDDAGLDAVEEALDLRVVLGEEARGQAVVG